VPAGDHQVSLAFAPAIVGRGIAISLAAWVLIMGLAATAAGAGLRVRRLAT